MYIKLFDLKEEMIKNGESMIDFSGNNFEVNYLDPFLKVQSIIVIKEEHLARPDLLSWEAYGNLEYIDAILKFNQITNPFSMDLYDLIICPVPKVLPRFYKRPPKQTQIVRDTKALFIDPKRASQKDINRLNQLAKIAAKRKNGSKEIKPTNLLRNGEVPFSMDGKVLRFAPSVSTPNPYN